MEWARTRETPKLRFVGRLAEPWAARATTPRDGRRQRSLVMRALAAGLGLFAVFGSGCASREALGARALSVVSAGVVNDPANKTLRFDLLQFGIQELCREMLRRGAPLKLSDSEPVVGRFFADGCDTQVVDIDNRQSVIVRFAGQGYAWTSVSGRLGFSSTGTIEYAADFQIHEQRLYIYFRPRSVGSVTFQPLLVESALARLGMGLSGVDAGAIGRDIVTRQLQRGFTVIRHSERGESEFSAGLIPLGERPFRPFTVAGERRSLDNDRTVVQLGQQDYVGGITLDGSRRKLYLSVQVQGAAGLDLFVVREADARALLNGYVHEAGARALQVSPVLDTAVLAGQPFNASVELPAGRYLLLFDHSTRAGRMNPASVGLAAAGATVDYLIQVD
jgi:hypothetical protein